MWGLSNSLGIDWKQTLPNITINGVIYLAICLLALRLIIHRVLLVYFQIREARPQHSITTLEYSYFYHLSIVVLILAEVNWNMFDLAIWVTSYIGVGFIRKAIYIIRIQRDITLNDYSYNKKIMTILSASKIFAILVFAFSVIYFITVQIIFDGVTIRLSSLLLFPTLMLGVDSLFLLFSSVTSQQQILSYFNQNINEIPSTYKIELAESMVGNSLRVWHYYNLIRLFIKAFFQRFGFLDCLWMLSAVNACFISVTSLYSSIKKYRSYSKLLESFNKVLRPSKTKPDQNCIICMTELLNCRRLSTCGHLFHYKCLFEWIQNKNDCPVCRAPIDLADQ